MNTKYWSVDKNVDNSDIYPQLKEAAQLLRENEVVAFPTETVYGLGGNALSDEAVMKIFEAKGRPSDNPLIIHIGEIEQLNTFVKDIPAKASVLMDTFWPGPLTIILDKKEHVLSDKATAGLSTVAVRIPDHPVAIALLKESGVPIAAPSANRSGKPSPTAAEHVREDLDGKIAGIVDGGKTGVGVESTVIDCTSPTPVILRPGGITKEQIEAQIGKVEIDKALLDSDHAPKSPGMKYTHYAPDAPLFLVKGTKVFIQELVNEERKSGRKVGVLTTEEQKHFYDADVIFACGTRKHLETVANKLYEALRTFDHENVNIIFSEEFPYEGVGSAVMNRLLKAAGHKIIEE